MKLSQIVRTILATTFLSACSDSVIRENTPEPTTQISPSTQVEEIQEQKQIREITPLECRVKNLMSNSISHHINQEHISTEGLILYLDPEEYIAPEGEGIGRDASNPEGTGDDITQSRQRLIYVIEYSSSPKTIRYEILDSFPCITAKRGFGFRFNSKQTPTGLFLLNNQNVQGPYQTASSKYPNITTATTSLHNLLDNKGNPIYTETSGVNDVFYPREIIIHSRGFNRAYELRMRGSDGCILLTTEDNWRFVTETLPEYENAYIFITGSSYSDLPSYEKNLLINDQDEISFILSALEKTTKENLYNIQGIRNLFQK